MFLCNVVQRDFPYTVYNPSRAALMMPFNSQQNDISMVYFIGHWWRDSIAITCVLAPNRVPSVKWNGLVSLIARFMGPTLGPSWADRTQVGPTLAPWILLTGHMLWSQVLECTFAKYVRCSRNIHINASLVTWLIPSKNLRYWTGDHSHQDWQLMASCHRVTINIREWYNDLYCRLFHFLKKNVGSI